MTLEPADERRKSILGGGKMCPMMPSLLESAAWRLPFLSNKLKSRLDTHGGFKKDALRDYIFSCSSSKHMNQEI